MQRFRHRRWIHGLVLAVLGVAALGACSDEEGGEDGTGGSKGGSAGSAGKFATGGSSGTSTGGTAGSAGTTGGTGGTTTGSGGGGGTGNIEPCLGLPIDTGSGGAAGGGDSDASAGSSSGGSAGACTGTSQEVERIDVDLFLMMDRSISMNETVTGGGTRWEALRTAVQELAVAPAASSLRAGIGFLSSRASTNLQDPVDCNADTYATPVVSIGPLSQTGSQIVAAIDGVTPGGLTPLVPALQGALRYAKTWAQANPDRAAAVVLVSDGYPTQCSNDPIAIAAAAAAALADTPSVRTFVIGTGKIALLNLKNYARSGGTNEPFVVEDADVVGDFVDTVLNIAASNLACDFGIPSPPGGTQIDPDRVLVTYTPASSGEPEEIPRVASLGACAASANGGWYYDNPAKPTKIYVCPCTCARFGAGGVEVRFGCRPRFG